MTKSFGTSRLDAVSCCVYVFVNVVARCVPAAVSPQSVFRAVLPLGCAAALTRRLCPPSRRYTFSHIYGPETGQQQLFRQTTLEHVRELLDGRSCLLFTYGATNSGKTHTVQGTFSATPRSRASLRWLLFAQRDATKRFEQSQLFRYLDQLLVLSK